MPEPIATSDVTLADTRRLIAALVTSSDGVRAYRVQVIEVWDGEEWIWWPSCNCKSWRGRGGWCRHCAATFGAWTASQGFGPTHIAS